MIQFLNQGSQAIQNQRDEMERSGRVMDREAIEKSREYGRAVGELNIALGELGRTFTVAITPAVLTVSRALTSFVELFRRGRNEADEHIGAMSAQMAELMRKRDDLQRRVEGSGVLEEMLGSRANWERLIASYDQQITALAEKMRLWMEMNGGEPPTSGALGKPGGQAPAIDTEAIKRMNSELQLAFQNLSGGQSLVFTALYGNSDPTTITSEFEAMMQRIDAAVQRGAMTAQQAAIMKRNVAMQEQALMMETAQLAASTITTVFRKSKGASIAAAGINTAVAITKALQLPFPFNWAQAALVAASGAAQISQIRGMNESGAGVGSAASSGGAAAPAPQTQENTLYVSGIQDGHWYSGSRMRELFEDINAHIRDGGRLVLG